MQLAMPTSKIAIIGAGAVGSSAAYALMLNGAASEIVLVDVRKEKAEGEALDLAHCSQFTDATVVHAGNDLSLLAGAAVVVLTAGVAQKPGEARSALLEANVGLFKDLIPALRQHARPDAIFLVVTNPLDVMTQVALELSGKDACHVFGTGTVLDTARLRFLVGDFFAVSPKDVLLNVLGQHGEEAFACWSAASVGGVPLAAMPTFQEEAMEKLFVKTKEAAGEIIRKKGATSYAIGLVIAKIIRAIVHNQARIFCVSTFVPDLGVCMSSPTIIRKSGLCMRLPMQLSQQEHVLYQRAAQRIAREMDEARRLL